MKVNSISGITCHVKDLARSAEFYEAIGFRPGKQEADRATFYVNWFFVTLVEAGTRVGDNDSGLFVYIKVDDLDEFYEAALSSGLTPDGEPGKGPSGIREFVLRDPDGYKLAFFQRK